MNAPIAIRRGTDTDREFVIDLGRRVALTSVSSLRVALDAAVEIAYDRLVDYVYGRNHTVLIALEGDEPAGFALVLHDLPDEVALTDQSFLAYMAVEPNRQRRGVGSALLTAVVALANERGFPHVSLMVTEDNVAARSLYAGAGFVTERRLMTKTL